VAPQDSKRVLFVCALRVILAGGILLIFNSSDLHWTEMPVTSTRSNHHPGVEIQVWRVKNGRGPQIATRTETIHKRVVVSPERTVVRERENIFAEPDDEFGPIFYDEVTSIRKITSPNDPNTRGTWVYNGVDYVKRVWLWTTGNRSKWIVVTCSGTEAHCSSSAEVFRFYRAAGNDVPCLVGEVFHAEHMIPRDEARVQISRSQRGLTIEISQAATEPLGPSTGATALQLREGATCVASTGRAITIEVNSALLHDR
jgi:hypothetical protein